MELQGITIDFYDMKTCGLLPDLCIEFDTRSEELEDNEELIKYWEDNLEKVLEKTKKVVCGNIDGKSILYSADKDAIDIIRDEFKGLELSRINYEDIEKGDSPLKNDYIAEQVS